MGLSDGAFTSEEVLNDSPVGQIVISPNRTVLHWLVNHAGTSGIVEGAIGDGVWQDAKVLIVCFVGANCCARYCFYHFEISLINQF